MTFIKTTEKVVHNDVLLKYLKEPIINGGLAWVEAQANRITKDGLVYPESLYRFLKDGNKTNQKNWAKLVRGSSEDTAKQKSLEALVQAVEKNTVVEVLRSGLSVDDCVFTLWNIPHQRGSLNSTRNNFTKNEFSTVSEISIFSSVDAKFKRVPDQAFYINGVLFSIIELKSSQTGQTAHSHGRKKIAGDFQEFAFKILQQVRSDYQHKTGQKWPGLNADNRKFLQDPRYWRNEPMRRMAAYTKTAWIAAIDMNNVYISDNQYQWMVLCDQALETMLLETEEKIVKAPINPLTNTKLMDAMVNEFSNIPDGHGFDTAWSVVKNHLECLLSHYSIAREIKFWHYSWDSISGSTNHHMVGQTITPRSPQRIAIHQIISHVDHFYANEHNPQWAEQDLRKRLLRNAPNMSEIQMEKIVRNRFKYRNGKDAYSVLIQGAAGLGKTNILVWAALELHSKLAPLPPGSHPNTVQENLYDRVVILTDRLDLRENIANEAERSGGSRNQVLNIDNTALMTAALSGEPLPSEHKSCGILVVNLQKFPSLYEAVKNGKIQIKHTVGRTAFLIDEIHRSQSGDLNEKTINTFVHGIVNSAQSSTNKKNLIVGFSATIPDPILARFGQWRPGISAADKACWVPHFSYGMNQAIQDGYVLNSLKGLIHYNVPLDILTTPTINNANNATKVKLSSSNIYENLQRSQKVARKIAEVFASTTMQVMKNGFKGVKVGRGKAMVTVSSINAAIQMADLIRKELINIAIDCKGSAWENYANIVKEVGDERVFVLYTSSAVGQGKTQLKCGEYNPLLGGANLTEKDIISAFRCKSAGSNHSKHNSIIVVVDKLLTGFNEPTLHTLFIDRSLSGIPLFQAMCRPNRTTEGKHSLLIVDTCHDESNVREAKRVFERYGGLTVSDLDGMDILDRLAQRRNNIDKWPGFKQLIKKSRLISTGERIEDIHAWADNLLKTPEKSRALRMLIGGYLADQKLAHSIMTLDTADTNEIWLSFLCEIHMLLKADTFGKNSAEVLFDVNDIEWDTQEELYVNTPQIELENLTQKATDPADFLAEQMEFEDLSDQIENLREIENKKMLRSQSVRIFLNELYNRIDSLSVKRNNDAFRRDLISPNSDTPYNEIMEKFVKFFDGSTDRSWIAKNDTERNQLKELARNHLDLLLGEYRKRLI